MSNDAVAGRTWFERDYPVLRAAVGLCQASTYNQTTTHSIAASTGLELVEVVKAVTNLQEAYLYVQDTSSFEGRDFIIAGATERGLVAADVWPSAELLTDRLVAAIERALDDAPTGSPKSTKLRTLLDALKDVSTGTAAGVLAMALASTLGLPT